MAHYVERLNLRVGDPIIGPKVEPDSIVEVIDPPTGHLVVALKTGGIHAWWGSWGRDPQNPNQMRKGLAHHGGKFGWQDIDTPIRQHQHVIGRYLGHEEEVEWKGPISARPQSLAQFAVAARVTPEIVEVQGRKGWTGEALYLINQASRNLIFPMSPEEMDTRRFHLEELRAILQRSTNPNFRSAGQNLAEALGARSTKSLTAFRRSEDNLLYSIIDMNDIVIATLTRGAALERYRWECENVVLSVYKMVLSAKADWDQARDEGQRQKVVENLTNLFGINLLKSLKAQPFRREVEDIFGYSHLDQLTDLWMAINYPGISRSVTRAEERLHSLSERIKTRRQGGIQLKLPT